jgi:hypothetical protein
MEEYFANQSDAEITQRIESLPGHLMEIYLQKILEGLTPRHALFIASSYSWRKPE